MCERYKVFPLKLKNGKEVLIDSCIYDLVELLNNNGYETVACCCGHGIRPANIALKDGREIIVARNYDEGRKIDKLFPPLSSA